jgi:hypothetical protein
MPTDEARRIDDPEHWRERAEVARALAEEMHDSVARQMTLDVAEGYERLAARVARRLLTRGPVHRNSRTHYEML